MNDREAEALRLSRMAMATLTAQDFEVHADGALYSPSLLRLFDAAIAYARQQSGEYVMVPREPTEAMIQAGRRADYTASTHDTARLIFRAMITSATGSA